MSFMTLALAQIFHLGNARSDRAVMSPQSALRNPYAIGAFAATLVLQLLSVEAAQLRSVLHLMPLGLREWLIVLLLSTATGLIGQAIKLVTRR
jgi:Ca2+-transporting ATPase